MDILTAFFNSWQVRTLAGLIALDLLLGLASAVRRKSFEWKMVANFYQTNVLPYVVGYGALYGVIRFVIPHGTNLSGVPLDESTITLAWVPIVLNLGNSILSNFRELYQPGVKPA